MRLSPAALAITAAIIWGGAIFVIGSVAALAPGYGEEVLSLVSSVYPGYEHSGGFGDLLIGTTYAFADGLVGGFVFALLYNAVLRFVAPSTVAADAGAPGPVAERLDQAAQERRTPATGSGAAEGSETIEAAGEGGPAAEQPELYPDTTD